MSRTHAYIVASTAALLIVAALAPSAFGALGGSGNVTDFIQLSTTTGSLALLQASAASGSGDVVKSTDAFHVDNAASNVDTFLLYSWASATVGTPAASSITLRSVQHYVSDLLWFRQETLDATGASTLAANFAPLVIKSDPSVKTVTFSAADALCSVWGAAPGGFTADAAGSFTVKHYTPTTTNDAALPTTTVYFCADSTADRVYLNSVANFTAATVIDKYTTDSAAGVLKPYQYSIAGNQYCLLDVTSSGATSLPVLQQCSKLPYAEAGTTAAKMYVLFDPPTYFPSLNQNGAVAFSLTGAQWNPYSDVTPNQAG